MSVLHEITDPELLAAEEVDEQKLWSQYSQPNGGIMAWFKKIFFKIKAKISNAG